MPHGSGAPFLFSPPVRWRPALSPAHFRQQRYGKTADRARKRQDVAESYFPTPLILTDLRQTPRAWCLLLRMPAPYTQDCHLLTPATPKQNDWAKTVFCEMNMPSFEAKHAVFLNPKSSISRVHTGSAAIFIPAAPSGCRRVSVVFIPARSAQAREPYIL